MSLVRVITTVIGMEALAIALLRFQSVISFIKGVWNFNVSMIEHWMNFFTGQSSRWAFLQDNIGPVPLTSLENGQWTSGVMWTFNTSLKSLTYVNLSDDDNENTEYIERRLPWLSACIYANGNTYDFDTFANEFVFYTSRDIHPTPKLLMYCWSLISKQWFTSKDSPYFEVIDKNGDIHKFQIYNRSIANSEKWTDLFVEDLPESDSEVEVEDEREEDDDDEDYDNTNTEEEDDHVELPEDNESGSESEQPHNE